MQIFSENVIKNKKQMLLQQHGVLVGRLSLSAAEQVAQDSFCSNYHGK